AILSSSSGETEETLSLAREAAARNVPCAAIASGGSLCELAARHGWPLHRVPGGMPPRAALFHAWVPLTTLVAPLAEASDPVSATRAIAVWMLRDGEDSAEVSARMDLVAEYAARQGAAVHEIRSQGDSRLARLASLVQFGDYLSLYLALAGGIDPTDIASID